MPESAEGPPPGLRERKKERTRELIRTHALRLFTAQGYESTTVQQIVEEIEVSESTFFRYFPNKADVVLTDDFDPLIVDAFQRQPRELTPIQAIRCAFRDAFGRLSQQEIDDQLGRMHVILQVPELRAAMLDQFAAAMTLLGEEVAQRTGAGADDLAVRSLAGAVVGVSMAAMLILAEEPGIDLVTLIDRAMEHLETGFSTLR